MKKIAFVLAVMLAASCTRHNLNYQSSHIDKPVSQDNYPADQAQSSVSGGVQNNYNGADNNNSAGQVDYSSPSYQTFYDGLSPYGNWVNYPTYGYVWVPNAGPDFTPYGTNGNWVYTSYGWTWNSGYNWGWAPFHYGNWFQDPYYGWMWVPGNQWAPAWVSWGSYNGYYGWAPVEPGAIVAAGYSPPLQNWRFVPAQNVTSVNVANYYGNNVVVQQNNIVLINNSSAYHQHTYFSGPPREDVEQATGSKINAAIIHESNKPVISAAKSSNLNLYRPAIPPTTEHPATPAKVTPIETLKPVNNNVKPQANYTPAAPKPAVVHSNNTSNTTTQKPAQQQQQPANNTQTHHTANKPKPAPKPAPKPKSSTPPPPQPAPRKN